MNISDRIEAMTKPCRDMDLEIAKICFTPEEAKSLGWCHSLSQLRNGLGICPNFTSSIDAAVSVIDITDDIVWSAEEWANSGVHAEHIRASVWVFGAPRVLAASVPIGICAAAMRARENKNDDGNQHGI